MNNGHAKPGRVEPVAEPGDKAPPPAEIVAAAFSGPIPPPAMFAQYEDALPGSADRILTQAEKEQDHRHQQEASLLRARIDDLGMARFYSFLTTCGVLGACGMACLPAASMAGVGRRWRFHHRHDHRLRPQLPWRPRARA